MIHNIVQEREREHKEKAGIYPHDSSSSLCFELKNWDVKFEKLPSRAFFGGLNDDDTTQNEKERVLIQRQPCFSHKWNFPWVDPRTSWDD